MAGEAQVLRRIPRIKFPQRHTTGAASKTEKASTASSKFFSSAAASNSVGGGQASLQPKRSPVSNDEIQAILLGGCI